MIAWGFNDCCLQWLFLGHGNEWLLFISQNWRKNSAIQDLIARSVSCRPSGMYEIRYEQRDWCSSGRTIICSVRGSTDFASINTVYALDKVWEYIAEWKKRGVFACLVTLDLKSAFNSFRRPDILRLLEERDFENYHMGYIESCVGPIPWLVVINILLMWLTEEEVWFWNSKHTAKSLL